MRNSAMQTRNVLGAFAADGIADTRPVLLIDDMSSSRWTLTVVARMLRRAGSSLVYPLVIAAGPS
jgi:ATP-dependent DNA helicase RecQ